MGRERKSPSAANAGALSKPRRHRSTTKPGTRQTGSAGPTPEALARIEALSEAFERELDSDRAFFTRFPHRSHRVRRSGRAEIATTELAAGVSLRLTPGRRWYTAVRQVVPGVRIRVLVANAADAEVDLSEELAADIFGATQMAGMAEQLAHHLREHPDRPQ